MTQVELSKIICFVPAVKKSLFSSLGDKSSILVSPLLMEMRKLCRPSSLKHVYICVLPSVFLTVKLQTSFVRHSEKSIRECLWFFIHWEIVIDWQDVCILLLLLLSTLGIVFSNAFVIPVFLAFEVKSSLRLLLELYTLLKMWFVCLVLCKHQ